MQDKDRRWGRRRSLQCKAWLRKDAGTFRAAQTIDIHDSGAQLWAPTPALQHTLLDLHVKLEAADPLKLRAMVAWCRPAEEGGYRLGLAFPRQSSSDFNRLRRWNHAQAMADQVA